MYFPHEEAHKYVKQILKEDGAAGGAVTPMTVGTGGFSNGSDAKGPVAGYDPVMKFKKNVKDRIKKRALPPAKIGGGRDGGLVSDNL